jgi:hypothetical protein
MNRENKTECGVQFIWDNHYWHTVPSEMIRKVRIIPSRVEGSAWAVFDGREHVYELTGENVEERAFAIAVGFAQEKEG